MSYYMYMYLEITTCMSCAVLSLFPFFLLPSSLSIPSNHLSRTLNTVCIDPYIVGNSDLKRIITHVERERREERVGESEIGDR